MHREKADEIEVEVVPDISNEYRMALFFYHKQ
jgi:hypothetical protein